MLNKIGEGLKKCLKKINELFPLEIVMFLILCFEYVSNIFESVKSFDGFTSFQWFVVVSLVSLVLSSFWLVCYIGVIKFAIIHKDNDKK